MNEAASSGGLVHFVYPPTYDLSLFLRRKPKRHAHPRGNRLRFWCGRAGGLKAEERQDVAHGIRELFGQTERQTIALNMHIDRGVAWEAGTGCPRR